MAIEDLRVKAGELAGAYQQLAEIDMARREFLTTIAHELRTPLTAASGFLQIVRLGMMQGEALQQALETVARNVEHIVTLVNDILFLQEMDLIFSDFEAVDIGAVVAASVEALRTKAAKNSVGINLTIAPNLPPVAGDAKSLERAYTAILDNAIKFSPDGGDVNVNVYPEGEWVGCSIQDHGVGIPQEALSKIFDRFFRVEQIGGHLFSGVGLGLSIAKQVIEQHQGKIDVQSTLGQGSEFAVHLRAATP
jgi:signal transduction histidine kinase